MQLVKPRRSMFDLSHYKRLTTKMGRLTPVFITECVPSDTFNGMSNILVRLAPLLAPIYDEIYLYVHYFFVPCRLLWEDWEEFITGGRLGVGIDPLAAPIPPYITIGDKMDPGPSPFLKSSLSDYLGVPMFDSLDVAENYEDIHLDTMPYLAYHQIYMDYYRDRNFISDDNLLTPYASGEMSDTDFAAVAALKIRSYEHDYFTSALPFVQRGEEVLMPLAGSASVTYLDQSIVRTSAGAPFIADSLMTIDENSDMVVRPTLGTEPGTDARLENIDEVNIASSDVSINDFRSAYALQVWLERNAIGGSRYNESTQAHFGVKPQDSRLQRAEYIGGGRIPIKISEIVSTAYSDDGEAVVPLANLGGHGITYGNTNRFHYFCTEHGFILGIASFMSPGCYDQGLPKMFRRRSFLDYPWPTFAKLGEQQVDKAELYANGANLTEDVDGKLPLFGYQSRYADWKFIKSTNVGDFHDALLFWTLTRHFAESPELGQLFNEFDTLTQERIFVVNKTADNFWCYVNNQVNVKRPLPYFSAPNNLGFA